MEKYIMGIDNGGTITKAALYTLGGKEVGIASKKTKMIMPKPYHTERDMYELWEANLAVIRELINHCSIDTSKIVGLAITGHGNGLYLSDKKGEPVYNGIISTDNRAKKYIEEWYGDSNFEEKVLPKTMQSVWAGQPVALLRWLKDYQPSVIEEADYIFTVKDYVRFKLTGEAFLELTDVSGTNLLNVRDRCYDQQLLSFFGIDDLIDKLPPLKQSTDYCGAITKEIAEMTGLQEGTPVAGGIFDIAASAVASGLVKEDRLAIVAGTWSINEYITKKPVIDRELFMTSIYCLDDYWLTTEASPTSASNLEWFIDHFMIEEKQQCALTGQSIYDICNELVEETTPEESQLVFFPFLFGSNTVPHATSCFIGMNSWHEKKHFIQAVYEGIVFGHIYHIERLLKYIEKPEASRIAGGVTKSDVWLQIFADSLQIPLEIVEVKEHGTLGTAMCAAVMNGDYESIKEAAEAMVKVNRMIQPRPENKAIYEKKYQQYKQTLAKMEEVWKVGI
ncbi:FGGY-family carbohydrate kinase [Cytobacillus sp. OWB-43]|uniref:FGGY-family carbohydrate kinase n=1 Tax=Cytobacillus sp. OWB-43 TaxID=3108468 RepID=UPI002AFF8EAB|nr:FGGY-family carbohydrate kinase [Cytobacillus sp. OWB-43]MEA1853544.1 FGGY-family carbohydrate kinase [Cytobacillus sp. OWB-43]